ncbi:MAG: Ig-like domain-containing protein [bacterium]
MVTISIAHAKKIISVLSKLGEDKYSEIASETDFNKKAQFLKTAIGPRMQDLEPDQVELKDTDGDGKISKDELFASLNAYLKENNNGKKELTEQQKAYIWKRTVNVVEDPGGDGAGVASSAAVTATTPSTSTTNVSPGNPSNNGSNAVADSGSNNDTTAPTLSSSSPSNGATDIAKNSNIDLTFSENIRLVDPKKVKLVKKSGDTSGDTEVEITRSVEGGKTLRMKPQAALDDSTEYYVKIESGAITDTSKNQNAYAGITADTGLSFTTGTTTLTSEQQPAVNKAPAATNNPVSASGVAPSGSNSFNTEVTKLNLDADDTKQSNDEKKLGQYMNLRYGLDLLESKEDVHVALGGDEESYVNAALESLKQSTLPDSQIDNYIPDEYEDGKTPTSPQGFVLKQAIEEYKKIDKKLTEIAEAARDKKIDQMDPGEKAALIKVFENYQEKFTKLKDGITEDKLKKYLTDNYDTLNGLGIDDFPETDDRNSDITTINGKNKEELITLSVAARNKLNEKISEEFEKITISPNDKKAFLKKYTDIDFSDSGKSIEFIKGLTDKELLLFNNWTGDGSFYSRDFIIRELSQHKLSLDKYFGFHTSSLSDDADLMSFTDRDNLLKKYDPKNTDLNQNTQFIKGLTPVELVLLNSSSGFVSKQSLLSELNKPANQGKPLDEIFGTGILSGYLEALKLKPLNEINNIVNDPQIKAALKKNTAPLEIGAGFKYSKDSINGELYRLGRSYLVDFGEGKAKFYKNQNEILGLPESSKKNYFRRLAEENKNTSLDLGYDLRAGSRAVSF